MIDDTMISAYCNRLLKERRISLSENRDVDGRIMYSVKFYQPEWFSELNDDLQYCIVANIQKYVQENIMSILSLSNNFDHLESIDHNYDLDNSDSHLTDTTKKRKFGDY